LKKILGEGFILRSMTASIPDVSSVSWTSFATGVNPGEHGIYGFMDLEPNSYSLYFPNSGDRQAPAFWEILGKTGSNKSTLSKKYSGRMDRSYRSTILNLPQTYPASPLNGTLVSGFVAIDLKKAVYPGAVYPYLDSIHYSIDVDAEKIREGKPVFFKELSDCFETRKKAISHFFGLDDWDLFFACITETDRLHHFFFDAAMDKTHPDHGSFVDFYARLDGWIKDLYERFVGQYGNEGWVMLLSDHGFAPIHREVYINAFLEKSGFLALRQEGEFYEKIGAETKAFCLDPCRLYLHDASSYPRGRVSQREKETVLEDLKKALGGLKGEDGHPVIHKMFRKEEIYRGPYLDRAPDLVCLPEDGYDLKGSLQKREVFGNTIFRGMHTWHDAFCILPESIPVSGKPMIEEMAGHLVNYFTSEE
jgi:predicted AlkP superfamily phosphohydrolase/phosphomutase